MSTPFPMPATADLARALHARHALEAALDHGTAMLAALGLPPLPSMTRAIALLDALDAPGEDMEPFLVGYHQGCDLNEDACALEIYGEGDSLEDAEESDPDEDDGAMEPALGSLDRRIDQAGWAGGSAEDREIEDEDDRTAPERAGRGFVRCALDDHEDGHDAEDERDGGTDDGEDFSHWTGPRRPSPLTERERDAVRALAGRARKMREAAHA